MRLGHRTPRRNLELTETLRNKENAAVLCLWVLDKTRTADGQTVDPQHGSSDRLSIRFKLKNVNLQWMN